MVVVGGRGDEAVAGAPPARGGGGRRFGHRLWAVHIEIVGRKTMNSFFRRLKERTAGNKSTDPKNKFSRLAPSYSLIIKCVINLMVVYMER